MEASSTFTWSIRFPTISAQRVFDNEKACTNISPYSGFLRAICQLLLWTVATRMQSQMMKPSFKPKASRMASVCGPMLMMASVKGKTDLIGGAQEGAAASTPCSGDM